MLTWVSSIYTTLGHETSVGAPGLGLPNLIKIVCQHNELVVPALHRLLQSRTPE